MTPSEFKRRMDKLQEAIFAALMCSTIWKGLSPEGDTLSTTYRYKEFFSPVQLALVEMLIINVTKIFDRHQNTISLHRLIDAGKYDLKLVPHASQEEIDKIEAHLLKIEKQDVLGDLKQARDQYLARLDSSSQKSNPHLVSEVGELLEGVKVVFNELCSVHDGSTYFWSLGVDRSAWVTAEILRVLQSGQDTLHVDPAAPRQA